MSRKLIRPTLHDQGLQARPAKNRRPQPPEVTNAEAHYLRQALQARALVVAELLGGGQVRGRLEGYDRECLKIQPDGGGPIMLRRAKVKYYWAERAPD